MYESNMNESSKYLCATVFERLIKAKGLFV